MSDILKDFSVPALINAMETNIQELSICWGELLGATFHEDAESAWFISGLPFELCNGVIRSHIDSPDQDSVVEKHIAQLMARDIPMTWLITPSTQPPDMGQRLSARGWMFDGEAPGMALDLLTLEDAMPVPPGLSIEQATGDEALDRWIRTMVVGSEMPERVLEFVVDLHSKHRFAPEPSVRFYLGSLNGEPVATSLLFLAGGVAGIYDVATLPDARGHGYGTALTAASLLDAREMGYRFAVLQSSPMGLNVYRRLGFQKYCSFSMYMWSGSRQFIPHAPNAAQRTDE